MSFWLTTYGPPTRPAGVGRPIAWSSTTASATGLPFAPVTWSTRSAAVAHDADRPRPSAVKMWLEVRTERQLRDILPLPGIDAGALSRILVAVDMLDLGEQGKMV